MKLKTGHSCRSDRPCGLFRRLGRGKDIVDTAVEAGQLPQDARRCTRPQTGGDDLRVRSFTVFAPTVEIAPNQAGTVGGPAEARTSRSLPKSGPITSCPAR